MEKKKKTASLIYNLFQKYKESMNEPLNEAEVLESAITPEPVLVTENAEEMTPPKEIEPVHTPFDSLMELYRLQVERLELSPGHFTDMDTFHQWIIDPIQHFTLSQNRKPEIEKILMEMCTRADHILEKLKNEEAVYETELANYRASMEAQETDAEEAEPLAEPLPPSPVNAEPHLLPLPDKMAALLFVFPPLHGGGGITSEQILKLLKDTKIIYGIKESIIEEISSNFLYMQIFLVAEGLPLIFSQDSYIIHHFKTETSPKISQDEHGLADFRNLNMFQTITAGTAICDIVPPAKGTMGYNIYKVPLLPKPPFIPVIPKGKNTALSEDQLKLIATCDGHISYKGNQYSVEPVLQIKENVDYSTGNIDFPGDVIIYGDVLAGFTIKADGDILIKGMAENATLYAEGNITIVKGMNGNGGGSIESKGEVKSSFLENCIVNSCGSIYANTIIACEIHSEDSVYAQGSQGVIIGGSITVLNVVEARMIGSKSLRKTTIVLGELPRILTNKNTLKLQQVETKTILDKLSVNITYLEKFKASLPPEKLVVLDQLQEQYKLYQTKKQRLDRDLLSFENITPDFSKCYIKSNMIFPFTQIHIGGEFLMVNETLSKAHISFTEDGIHQGTF